MLNRILSPLTPLFLLAVLTSTAAMADEGQHLGTTHFFIRSAQVNADFTQVTLPLFRGTSHGQTVYYVITDSSDRSDAATRGVNYAPKLANAKGTAAVQIVTVVNGVVDFPATVDFSPNRTLIPGPTGFPPALASPGAVGEPGYSPLIQMPDGTVLNAPQIARDANGDSRIDPHTESADKIVALNTAAGFVTYLLTPGFYDNRVVHYASFDSSSPVSTQPPSSDPPDREGRCLRGAVSGMRRSASTCFRDMRRRAPDTTERTRIRLRDNHFRLINPLGLIRKPEVCAPSNG